LAYPKSRSRAVEADGSLSLPVCAHTHGERELDDRLATDLGVEEGDVDRGAKGVCLRAEHEADASPDIERDVHAEPASEPVLGGAAFVPGGLVPPRDEHALHHQLAQQF